MKTNYYIAVAFLVMGSGPLVSAQTTTMTPKEGSEYIERQIKLHVDSLNQIVRKVEEQSARVVSQDYHAQLPEFLEIVRVGVAELQGKFADRKNGPLSTAYRVLEDYITAKYSTEISESQRPTLVEIAKREMLRIEKQGPDHYLEDLTHFTDQILQGLPLGYFTGITYGDQSRDCKRKYDHIYLEQFLRLDGSVINGQYICGHLVGSGLATLPGFRDFNRDRVGLVRQDGSLTSLGMSLLPKWKAHEGFKVNFGEILKGKCTTQTCVNLRVADFVNLLRLFSDEINQPIQFKDKEEVLFTVKSIEFNGAWLKEALISNAKFEGLPQ